MSLMSRIAAPLVIAASFSNAALAQENIQDVITDWNEGPAYNNPFDCSNPDVLAGKSGPLSNEFANAFWSRNECGFWDEADALLNEMPKAEGEIIIPTLDEFKNGDPFAICYYRQLPFENIPIKREENIVDQLSSKTSGQFNYTYGPYSWPSNEFEKIHRVMAANCVPMV